MSESELSELVSGRSEDLSIEYKAWMDTSNPENKAKLAKHLAALANHGGGYLVFGIDDTTRTPLGDTQLDRHLFDQDAIAGVVRKYLDPRIQVRIEEAEHEGVRYPVAIVPSHGPRPVVAIADGPQVNGKPVGIRQGEIYVRAAGPESAPIRSPDDWAALMERCLAHRADLMSKLMRQALARPGKPSRATIELLTELANDTAADFAAQARTLAADIPSSHHVARAASANCTLGYGLVDGDGASVELENLRALAGRAAVRMREWAYSRDGWAPFLPLARAELSPQMRSTSTSSGDHSYLEGMRLPNMRVVGGVLDYWRIYQVGVAVSVQNYRDDYMAEQLRVDPI